MCAEMNARTPRADSRKSALRFRTTKPEGGTRVMPDIEAAVPTEGWPLAGLAGAHQFDAPIHAAVAKQDVALPTMVVGATLLKRAFQDAVKWAAR